MKRNDYLGKGMTRRAFLKGIGGGSLVITLTSFSARKASGAVKQDLVVAYDASDALGWDPMSQALPTPDKTIAASLYNGLLKWPDGVADLTKLEPDLAESWEVSGDGLQWTFKLREGVRWHTVFGVDFGEFTAEDAAYSLTRAADPKRSAFAGDFSVFRKFEATDRYTLRVTLAYPVSPATVKGLLTDYHGGQILCKKALEKYGDAYPLHPVGTGPFKFQEYSPNESSTWLPHERYFRGKPHLSSYQMRYMADLSSRELAFRKGDVQLIEGVREQHWVDKMRAQKDTETLVFGPGELVQLHLNMTRKPFDDIRVRKAVFYAIDRDGLIRFIGKDTTEREVTALQKHYLGALTEEELPKELLYDYDPDKAKDLLAQAGYPKGFDVEMVITERASYRRAMVAVQEMLRKVGIRLKLNVITHPAYHSQIRKDVNPMVLYICTRFPTGDQMLTQFFHSRSIVGTPTGVTNFSHYTAIDELLDKARQETDPAVQVKLWKEAQLRILEDAVAYPLYTLKFAFAKKPWLDIGYELQSTMHLGVPIRKDAKILEH
ncbi:MAG: polyamine ABC transporter substrate-binding protein [Nitrospinota bacterium]|nr:MAG: polyamine ABC transporter substrate-binding protein [Nitrospinota bacterium]